MLSKNVAVIYIFRSDVGVLKKSKQFETFLITKNAMVKYFINKRNKCFPPLQFGIFCIFYSVRKTHLLPTALEYK